MGQRRSCPGQISSDCWPKPADHLTLQGLGEMTLKNFTHYPRPQQTVIPGCRSAESNLETENTISQLMGKDTQARYEAIMSWMEVVDFIDV